MNIVVNGLPEVRAIVFATRLHIASFIDVNLKLVPYSLKGAETNRPSLRIREEGLDPTLEVDVQLAEKNERKSVFKQILQKYGQFIAVDFLDNDYCKFTSVGGLEQRASMFAHIPNFSFNAVMDAIELMHQRNEAGRKGLVNLVSRTYGA